jgi:hypothetical protein
LARKQGVVAKTSRCPIKDGVISTAHLPWHQPKSVGAGLLANAFRQAPLQ